MKGRGWIVDVAAVLVCIGAGVYLLSAHTVVGVPGETSWFQILAHGIGAYFIAKGLWMARSLQLSAESRDRLNETSDFLEWLVHHEAANDPEHESEVDEAP